MAAMAPALTDAPAEARHIRLKLAAASSGLSPSSVENNGNATNILLSSTVSPSNAGANGKRHHLAQRHQDGCRCSRDTKGQQQESHQVSRPLGLGKLKPLVASYLCSDVAPVAKEPLKSHGLLNCSLFHTGRGGDYLLRKALSGGQPKGPVNGTKVGGEGSAMVPVNGLARKVAVPSTALPEKGSVATVNGDNAKPVAGGEALLPLPSKSGDAVNAPSVPRADAKQQRELTDAPCRAPEDTGPGSPPVSQEVKFETVHASTSDLCQTVRSQVTNGVDVVSLDTPQTSASTTWSDATPISRSSSPNLETLLYERTQQSTRRQADISGRLQRLCKRLQVVQAKQVERHIRQQLSGFVDRTLTQAPCSSGRGAEGGTWKGSRGFLEGGSVPSELEELHLSGSAHLRAAESGFDSDATESSSGGESDIEEKELSHVDIEQQHINIWRRAEGRFALERASIISRWTWLQAHISDLEYRIRQHADIYRQIRASKGPVELGDVSPSGPLCSQNAPENLSQFYNSRSMNGMLRSSAAESSDSKSSSSPDSSCTAARVRPLINCRRRHIIQPGLVPNLYGRAQTASSSSASECGINSSCTLCGESRITAKTEQFELPLMDRAAPLDPSVHPTLSLPSDLPLSAQLQTTLKSNWQNRHIDEYKPLKKLSLKHRPFFCPSSSSLTKHKFRLSNSHMAAVKSHHSSRSDRSRRQQPVDKLNTHVTRTPCSLNRKRGKESFMDQNDSPKFLNDPTSPCVQPSTPSTLSRQLSLPNNGSTLMTPTSSTAIKKRRSENSFDINNVVIPMSVASTTRVEKPQYKEIITPSWRVVDLFSQPLSAADENVEVEDLSDAAFAQLHQKCEEQERSRWRWTAIAPAKKRGSRSYKSLDGRTTPSLSGTNPSTPQPSSPDTGHFHLLQDYGPVPSPLSPPSPDTPCSRDAHTPSSRDSHTPHVKNTHRTACSEDTRCSTPDCSYEDGTVQPWERRNFPLREEPVMEPEPEPLPRHGLHSGMQTGCYRGVSESDASSP